MIDVTFGSHFSLIKYPQYPPTIIRMRQSDDERHPFVIQGPPEDTFLSHVSIVEKLMDVIPYGRLHYHLLFTMTFVHGCFGFLFTSDAIGLSTLQNVYSMTDIESGGLVSAIAVGIAVMSPVAGLLSDSVGRKKIILFGILLAFLVSAMKPFVATVQWQMTLRVIQGAACACVWVPTPVMIAEEMPKQVRGPLTLLYCVGWPIFSGFSALIGWWLLQSPRTGWWMEGWQWYFFLSSLPLLPAAVMVHYFVYESPRYHAAVGNHATAKRILEEMYALNGKKRPQELTVVNWVDGTQRGSVNASQRHLHRPTLPSSSSWTRLCCTSDTLALYAVWICIAGKFDKKFISFSFSSSSFIYLNLYHYLPDLPCCTNINIIYMVNSLINSFY